MNDNNTQAESTVSAYVHTMQIASAEMPTQDKFYSKGNPRPTARGFLTAVNPNKYCGYDIGSYTELMIDLNEIADDLEIYDWYVDRQDIAIDIQKPYLELRKVNKYLINLFALYMNNPNVTERLGARDLKSRSLYIKGRKYAFEIYDKTLESNGRRQVTRCEFRFLLLQPETDVFKDLYQMLDSLPKQIDKLNKIMIDSLYARWVEESDPDCEGGVMTLPEFYRKYAVDITTPAIARGLHDKVLSGNYNNWIKKFRSKNKLTFISKKMIADYCKYLKEAVKSYEDAPVYTLRWTPKRYLKGVPFEPKFLSEKSV